MVETKVIRKKTVKCLFSSLSYLNVQLVCPMHLDVHVLRVTVKIAQSDLDEGVACAIVLIPQP